MDDAPTATAAGHGEVPVDDRVRSAVLVPVYRDEHGLLRVVMILRAPGGRHGGQVGFPGGKLESSDGSLLEAAIREAREEIGLGGDQIVQLEALPEAVTQTTGFSIQPYLACIRRPPTWHIAPAEVARVLEPDVAALCAADNTGSTVEHHPRWNGPRQIDYVMVEGHGQQKCRSCHLVLPRGGRSCWRAPGR